MKSEVAQEKLDEIVSLTLVKEEMALGLSDAEVLDRAKRALYDTTHPHQDGINNGHFEQGGPAVWSTNSVVEWLADPARSDIDIDQSLESQVELNAIVREFLIRCVPKLNETFHLGLTIVEGERG